MERGEKREGTSRLAKGNLTGLEALPTMIAAAAEEAIELRRQLHRVPEPGRGEWETAKIVEEALKGYGIAVDRPVPTLPTAVCGMTCGGGSGAAGAARRLVALRAELDALPISEETDHPFRSEKEGYMHACGHDVHMAVLLGTARVLQSIRDYINVDVKYIFQPDEEKDGGAEKLIEAGVLAGADLVLGLHVKPELPAGAIGLRYGKVHAASIMFKITVTGKKAHGAMPHRGRDAAVTAASIISNAQTIISRDTDPLCAGVISFGRISGGTAGNVIADKMVLEGILRGEDAQMCLLLKTRLAEVASGTAKAMGVKVLAEFQDGYPALINDDSVVNDLRGAVKEYNRRFKKEKDGGGQEEPVKIREIEEFSMTVDDFSYYLQECPGAYFFLGSGFAGRENAALHTESFEVDERCIETGITALCAMIVHLAQMDKA